MFMRAKKKDNFDQFAKVYVRNICKSFANQVAKVSAPKLVHWGA